MAEWKAMVLVEGVREEHIRHGLRRRGEKGVRRGRKGTV